MKLVIRMLIFLKKGIFQSYFFLSKMRDDPDHVEPNKKSGILLNDQS